MLEPDLDRAVEEEAGLAQLVQPELRQAHGLPQLPEEEVETRPVGILLHRPLPARAGGSAARRQEAPTTRAGAVNLDLRFPAQETYSDVCQIG